MEDYRCLVRKYEIVRGSFPTPVLSGCHKGPHQSTLKVLTSNMIIKCIVFIKHDNGRSPEYIDDIKLPIIWFIGIYRILL